MAGHHPVEDASSRLTWATHADGFACLEIPPGEYTIAPLALPSFSTIDTLLQSKGAIEDFQYDSSVYNEINQTTNKKTAPQKIQPSHVLR